MKEFDSVQVFNYPWDYVSAANWRKYPNEQSAHVVGVDVLRREVSEEGKLITERLITCKQPIPKWLQYLVGVQDKSFVREVSTIDPINEVLTMRSVNLTMTNLLKVNETVIYKPDPNDVSKTMFIQNAKIVSNYGWSNVQTKVESWAVDRFSQNALKGKAGFDSVLAMGLPDVGEMLDELKDKFFFEINHVSNQIIHEIDSQTTEIIGNLQSSTLKIVDEIKDSKMLNEINESTIELLNKMNQETNDILTQLNAKTNDVIRDVNQKSISWFSDQKSSDKELIVDIQDKTHKILDEFNGKKAEVLAKMDHLTDSVFRALDKRSLEIFSDKRDNNKAAEQPDQEKKFLDKLLSMLRKQ